MKLKAARRLLGAWSAGSFDTSASATWQPMCNRLAGWSVHECATLPADVGHGCHFVIIMHAAGSLHCVVRWVDLLVLSEVPGVCRLSLLSSLKCPESP